MGGHQGAGTSEGGSKTPPPTLSLWYLKMNFTALAATDGIVLWSSTKARAMSRRSGGT